jgi:hypothetical protein
MLAEDISIYLPKFLSSESTQKLFQCLSDFPIILMKDCILLI